MFTLGWALAAMAGALAGVLVAPSVFLGPNSFDPILIGGFVAAVLGGLDSPPGAVVGGLVLGLALSYVSGYAGSALVPLAALVILVLVLMIRPGGLFSAQQGAAGVSAAGVSECVAPMDADPLAGAGRGRWASCCCVISESVSAYNDLQLATGAYYFAALAGLTVLAGLSGQISLGHGALMAIGAYTVALLMGNERWALRAGAGRLGGGHSDRRDPARRGGQPPARAVPGRRHARVRGRAAGAGRQVPADVRRRERADDQPPDAARRRWGSRSRWSSGRRGSRCAGALVVLFVLYNVIRSGVGRSMRAVRDDEIAASLCGLRWAAPRLSRSSLSAGCAGLGGGMLAVVLQLAQPGAFPLQLSLSLLTGVVLGGLGSLVGAIWGAALLTLLPNWTNDMAHSFSLSTKVSANLPLAIYGLVLIVAMLLWPSGIQGGVRAAVGRARAVRNPASAGRPTGASTPGSA